MKRSLIFSLIALFALSASAQLKIQNPVLEPLPQDNRQAFVERYNTFLASQLKHDWNGAYELLSPVVRKDQTKVDFVRMASTGVPAKLKTFTASHMEITFQSGQLMTAFVVGCGTYEGDSKKQASVMPASRWSGQWYFAPVQTLAPGANRAPKECQ